jgi:hypothetical protein
MELTQDDFEERLSRVEDGTADDEDHRLVKHYRREGFEPGGSAPASTARNPFADDDESEQGGVDYAKLTKKQLIAELDKRKDVNGDPLIFDRQAGNATMVKQLEENDRATAEREA